MENTNVEQCAHGRTNRIQAVEQSSRKGFIGFRRRGEMLGCVLVVVRLRACLGAQGEWRTRDIL